MIKSYAPLSASRRYSADSSVAGGTNVDRRQPRGPLGAERHFERHVARRDDQHVARSRVVERRIADVVLVERVLRLAVELDISAAPTSSPTAPSASGKTRPDRFAGRHFDLRRVEELAVERQFDDDLLRLAW